MSKEIWGDPMTSPTQDDLIERRLADSELVTSIPKSGTMIPILGKIMGLLPLLRTDRAFSTQALNKVKGAKNVDDALPGRVARVDETTTPII